MIFQDITTDQQWSEAIELRNLFNWCYPMTVAEAKSFFELSKATRNDDRFVGLDDQNVIVTHGGVTYNRNADDGTYWFTVYLDPHKPDSPDRFRSTVREGIRRVEGYQGTRAMLESRGEYGWCSQVLRDEGFSLEMTAPFSGLNVQSTDFSSDPCIISASAYLAEFPTHGLHDLWRLEMDVASDLPLPYPFVETPFESFSKMILDPEVDLSSYFLLVEDGKLKGLSQVWPSRVNRKLAATGLTGVRREFRRQRVASRLKQHAINWAAARGIERIFTDNEENNPMYQLNLQLGFRHMFDYEVYSKTC